MRKVLYSFLIACFLGTSGMAEDVDVIPTAPNEADTGAPALPTEPVTEPAVKSAAEAKPARNPARKKHRRKKNKKHRRHHR